jgi:1,4-dihydroxy-2-naphthoyl-CoA hydrolase
MTDASPIWYDEFPLQVAEGMAEGCMLGHLGIELTDVGADYLSARMPVDHRTHQPAGILHGGASVVLAETVASWAATFTVDHSRFICVGQEINANHIRPVRAGFVYGTARPVHLGRATQVWDVRITDQAQKLVCISRVTMAVREVPGGSSRAYRPTG